MLGVCRLAAHVSLVHGTVGRRRAERATNTENWITWGLLDDHRRAREGHVRDRFRPAWVGTIRCARNGRSGRGGRCAERRGAVLDFASWDSGNAGHCYGRGG